MPLTGKEIAERIAASDADIASSVERVRHWTREGLLELVGDRNPGTGRKRLYDEQALTTARILNALASFGVGIGLTGKDYFHTAFALAKDAAKTIEQRKQEGFVCFLSINKGKELGANPVVFSNERPDLEIKIVGSEEVFRLRDHPPMHPLADSAIIINLTKLLT
jgi:hypothetical protein